MTGSSRLNSATLREAVRKRVEATSLRAVADEIGMSFSGLRSYLEGKSSPHAGTHEKLVRWYYSRSKSSPAVSKDDLETALALVITYLRDETKPREVRERRLREVVSRLESASD